VLGICLPVPLLAVTGLSIPLPASVERLAASLVPWAESSTVDASGPARGAGGSIIRTPDEGGSIGSQGRGSSSSLGARAEATTASGSKPAATQNGAPGARTRPGVTPDDQTQATAPADATTPGESRQESNSGGAADSPVQAPSVERPGTRQEAPPPPGPQPPPPPPPPAIAPPPPPPIGGIVEDTARPIVDDVGNTVDNVTQPVIGVKPVEAVKGVVPIGRK
jgi:hypothetical protein